MHSTLRTPHTSKEGRVLSWASLMYGIGLGLLLPIFPGFIESVLKSESLVGYFYSGTSIAMVLAGIASSFFFKKFSRMKILYFFFLVASMSTVFLVFVGSFYNLVPLEFLRVFSALIIIVSFSLMIRDFTTSKNLGKTEGLYYLFNNIGWLIGPIAGGFLAKHFGSEIVFVLSGLSFLVSFFYILHQHLIKNHPWLSLPHAPRKRIISENRFKVYFRRRGRLEVYILSVAFFMRSSLFAITIPLLVTRMGYGSDLTGLIMSISIIPFILFEIPIGSYADKHGLKKPIAAGFFILAICALFVKFSPYFFLSALFLILANIGSAFIEPLRDVYFFKNVSKEEEDDLYGIYTTSEPLAKFIGPALISTCFLFMPFEWVYVVFAGIFLLGGLFTLSVKSE